MHIGKPINIKKCQHLIYIFEKTVRPLILPKKTIILKSSYLFVAFGGEYTLFAGLEECLKFVRDYQFHPTDIEYLRTSLPPYIESDFFDYLSTLNMHDVQIYAIPEGKRDTSK